MELKPCPFCGSDSAYPDNTLSDETTVQCQDCEALINTSCSDDKDAVARWNTRAPTPREQELEQGLAEWREEALFQSKAVTELEAQNKALWELVGTAESTLDQWANPTEQFTDISEWGELVKRTLAAIQKAKEVKK